MSNIVKLRPTPETLSEDERLRLVAQRALAPPEFPFDGLHIDAAMVLSQLGLMAEALLSAPDKARSLNGNRGEASNPSQFKSDNPQSAELARRAT